MAILYILEIVYLFVYVFAAYVVMYVTGEFLQIDNHILKIVDIGEVFFIWRHRRYH